MISIFKQFYRFCKKHKKQIQTSLILSTLESFCDATKLIAIYLVLYHFFHQDLSLQTLWEVLGIMVLGLTLAIVFRKKSSMLQTKFGYSTAAEKRVDIAEHLKYIPMGYFNQSSLSRVTAVATNTCNTFQEVATLLFMMVGHSLLYSFVVTLLFFFFDWRFGLFSLLGIVVFFAFNSYIQKRADTFSKRKVEADSQLTQQALEFLHGMVVVKSFGLGNQEDTKLDKSIDENGKVNLEIEFTLLPVLFFQSLCLKVIAVGMMYCSIFLFLQGQMRIYDAIMILISAFVLFLKLEAAGGYASLLKNMQLSMKQIEEIQDTPVMDIEGEDLMPKNFTFQVQNVDFQYEQRQILKDITLTIPEKKRIAIVGPSGSGKTTLTHLLARFWDVEKGAVLLGERNLKEYKLDSLWNNLSVVFQNVYLFNDTVENNIKFGTPNGTRKEVEAAAKKACCYEMIQNLPQGFDTVIGVGGVQLSGGEEQRISIARAIMKDAPIIILDEATANVDPENEKELILALESLTSNKTVIMIAHRLKTVVQADQIVVLQKGKIEDVGRHEELLARGGTYANFIHMRKEALSWKV